MFDPLDTRKNWQAVMNTSLRVGSITQKGNHAYRITGFGAYFLQAVSLTTGNEVRLTGWEE